MSPWAVASATVATGRPSSVAASMRARVGPRADDDLVFRESWLFRAWACPWLP